MLDVYIAWLLCSAPCWGLRLSLVGQAAAKDATGGLAVGGRGGGATPPQAPYWLILTSILAPSSNSTNSPRVRLMSGNLYSEQFPFFKSLQQQS